MWLRNSRNQFIRSGFKHAGQNKEGEEYEEKRYLCTNESWIDGMECTDGVVLGAPDSVCHGPSPSTGGHYWAALRGAAPCPTRW
jgi:hypothetical protein